MIIPLYLSAIHHILCDVGASHAGYLYDKGAKITYQPHFHGIPFARFYDTNAFKNRVVHHADGLKLSILYCNNVSELNPDKSLLYLRYIGVFEKI